MEEINIVQLIETSPITKLSCVYNNRFINKLKVNFINFEQRLFVSNFYCYLNYDKNNDFIINLDNIWEWLGFKQKVDCKRLLEKNFIINTDYKYLDNVNLLFALDESKANLFKNNQGGHNKQTILLTIKCFKSLCLKSRTSNANKIHDYYLKMEEILCQIIEEETDELRLQLKQKDEIILEVKKTIRISKTKSS